jgi:enoyl-CoA hydratase/carnithine racemase
VQRTAPGVANISIRYIVGNGVATLEICRPERRNALTQEMYAALVRGLEAAAADDAVRAVLIVGQPGIFTAGNELTEFVASPPTDADAPVFRFMLALARMEKPVVAGVTGHAVGIGVTMLLHCDLVYVAAGAMLTMPFVNLGLVPEFASSLLLPQLLGHVRAAERLLLGTPIAAEEAVSMGIANMVVPPGQVVDVAREAAERFNALPADGLRESKRLMKRALARLVEQTINEEFRVLRARLGGPEVREAVSSFFEKRAPDFSSLAKDG